jgi:hypothetical protein
LLWMTAVFSTNRHSVDCKIDPQIDQKSTGFEAKAASKKTGYYGFFSGGPCSFKSATSART